jgi:SPX domain protein involved in polyphosphate accumulation
MQQQRFELKYLIQENTALMVRDFVRSYLEMDEYSVGRPNYSYPVHSLYVDSDDLRLYWETINGNKNRYKLRLRYYSTNPDAPVFFEIKRRVNNCILKQRGGVRQDSIAWLLNGHLPEESHLVSKTPRQAVALQRFCQLMHDMQGKPRVHIAYLREAYVSDDDTVRVTLDREVMAEPNLDSSIKTQMTAPVRSYHRQVILELKFTNRFPNWFGELVRTFNIMQCGAAKYVSSIEGIGSGPLGAVCQVVNEGVAQGGMLW